MPLVFVLELEEGEASGFTSLPTEDDPAICDFAVGRKEISEFRVADLVEEVADKDTEGHELERGVEIRSGLCLNIK